MDIWENLYETAKELYHPDYISPFIYCHHVVCAIEAEDGTLYRGFCIRSCSGVANLCAERVAALNMLVNSGQTVIKRILTFRDEPPSGNLCIPCGACREFLMQLSVDNFNTLIMTDYTKREFVKLGELIPKWWGFDKLDENNKC